MKQMDMVFISSFQGEIYVNLTHIMQREGNVWTLRKFEDYSNIIDKSQYRNDLASRYNINLYKKEVDLV